VNEFNIEFMGNLIDEFDTLNLGLITNKSKKELKIEVKIIG